MTKITLLDFLAKRKAKEEQNRIDEHMKSMPWLTLESAKEELRVLDMTDEQKEEYLLNEARRVMSIRLGWISNMTPELQEKLMAGGTKYLHEIASSLPYQLFHDIAHLMIGSEEAGC